MGNPISPSTNIGDLIELLQLKEHPEGGYYREVYRDHPSGEDRGTVTLIYYLLGEGQRSKWHRIDATEIWHFYAGSPLKLTTKSDEGSAEDVILGPDSTDEQAFHSVVPPGVWQTAVSLGAWSLVGCTVAPAFRFEGFEVAPPGQQP